MSQENIVLSVDCGTTAIKAAAFTLNGDQIASVRKNAPLEMKNRVIVSDFIQSVRHVKDGLRELVLKVPSTHRIIAVSITTQRATCAFFSQDNEHPDLCISWTDPGGAQLLENAFDPERYTRITGLPLNPYITLTKICWVRKYMPEIFRKLSSIQLLSTYLMKQLGASGQFTDRTNASATGLFDIEKLDWSDEILNKIGISRDLLPTVLPADSVAGTISRATSEETGIPEGTPIISAGGDQQCAYLGSSSQKDPIMCITIGTSSVICCKTKTPVRLPPLLSFCGISDWTVEGFQPSTGACFNWFWRNILKKKTEFNSMDSNKLRMVPAGSDGVRFYPYLAGAALPCPDPEATGVFTGLTSASNAITLMKALFEGVAYETRCFSEFMAQNGICSSKAVITGGYSSIRPWLEIYSNVLNKEIVLPEQADSGLLGAAIQGGTATGIFRDFDHGFTEMFRTAESIIPNSDTVRRYDGLFSEFKEKAKIIQTLGRKNV